MNGHGPDHLGPAGFCNCGRLGCCLSQSGDCLCDDCACQETRPRPATAYIPPPPTPFVPVPPITATHYVGEPGSPRFLSWLGRIARGDQGHTADIHLPAVPGPDGEAPVMSFPPETAVERADRIISAGFGDGTTVDVVAVDMQIGADPARDDTVVVLTAMGEAAETLSRTILDASSGFRLCPGGFTLEFDVSALPEPLAQQLRDAAERHAEPGHNED